VIINLAVSIFNARRNYDFIFDSVVQNSRLLYLKAGVQNIVPSRIFSNFFHFVGNWVPGYLSNFRYMRHKAIFFFKKKFMSSNFQRNVKTSTILTLASMGLSNLPNILYAANTDNYNASVLNESWFLRMPSGAILLPSPIVYLYNVVYPIHGTSTFQSNSYRINDEIECLLKAVTLTKKTITQSTPDVINTLIFA